MTSTNDGKDVKSNQTSGQKDKKYFIELYKSLDARLIAGGDLRTCTQSLCDAWRRVHSLCQHSTPKTHPHLLAWIQRHTARVILLTEWQSPKSEHLHSSLAAAIDSFVEERDIAVGNRNGHSPPWECQLLQRAQWFKGTMSNPWGHPVLKALLDPAGERPSYDEILEWLKEELGVMFVSRLRQLAASKKCDDLALALASVVTGRARADATPFADADQVEEPKDKPPTETSETTFESILRNEAGFTPDIWDLLTDIEFVLLHKIEGNSRCIELAKLTPLHNSRQLIERLASRLDAFPREKKLWKNAKEVAMLVAQVTVARCMVVPQCAGPASRALYGAALALARLAQGPRLAREAATLAAPAATAAHLHTLAAAVHAHAQLTKCEDRKLFVCELYVRAITSGMYELEKLKMKTEEDQKARSAEKTLAKWFMQLGSLLGASARIQCECTLTAFSLHPAPDMYEKIKAAPDLPPVAMDFQEPQAESTSDYGSWANDSRSNTNFVKTSETLNIKHKQHQANVLSTAILTEGEGLGLSAELCQDIAVLLSGPRVKTLSWDVDRQLLLENCRTYMERTHGGTRALTTELKYLNLDPRCFEHLPEEQDDENDLYYGIEKGYEHLVEFEPQPEEIWQYAWETEQTESAYSDCIDSDHRASTVTRRKKKVKQPSTSDEDSDPLSQVAEAKRTEKKKERPLSKERSKDTKKSKSHAKDPTQKEIDRRKARTEKKKEKKERKKKENLESQFETKPIALSNLIGTKVANMSILHADKTKVKEEDNLSNVFIDSDPNSEGNESSIVYDGQFSMDELKSPERKSPDIIKNVHVNKNNHMNVSIVDHRPKRPPTPPPRLNINKNLQLNNTSIVKSKIATPALNESETSRLNSELNTQNKVQDVKEQVKQSITKLIQFRRQKLNATVESASVIAPLISQSISNKPILPQPTHQNKSGLSSLVGAKIVNAPKVQLDSKQTEQLVDFKNEINNFLSNANNQRPVIQYANKNYGPVTFNKHQIKESCSRVQPVAYHFSKQPSTNATQTNRPQQSKPPIIVQQNQGKVLNNKPHKQELDPLKHIQGHQQTFQEFVKEFEHTKANLLKMPWQRQLKPTDRPERVRKQMKPVSKVTPVIPNTIKAELIPATNVKPQPVQPSVNKLEQTVSPQCAKPTLQNKLDNAPNTFARRIYMHKNNPKTKRVVQHPTLQNSVSAEIDRRIESLTLKMKNQSKDLVISRVANDALSPKIQTPPRVEIQKVDKSKPAVKLEGQHPVLMNILHGKSIKQKEALFHDNLTKAVPTEPIKSPAPNLNRYTSLTEKDQQDLLVLLRQQSVLQQLKPELNTYKIHNGQSSDMPSASYTVTSNKCATSVPNVHKPVEVRSNLDDRVITMLSDPTASKQPSMQKKVKPVKESKPKITYTKTLNFDPNTIQKTALDLKKDNSYEDSSNVTQTNHSAKQDWARVLDALRSHKTPSRGPNAIDMVLKKDSYATYTDNSLRNQRIVKPSTVTEGIKIVAKPNPPAVMNKVTNALVKSSTSTTSVIAKPHKSDIPTAQSQAIKKLNLNEVTVKYPDKRQLPYELQKADDPFISGIPNSDYDLLEELMDDDLRQEIGELLSDEECYRSPTGAIPKSSKINNNKITENVLTKSAIQKKPNLERDQQILTNVKDNLGNIQQKSASNIVVKNTHHNTKQSSPMTSNNKPIIISNEKVIHKITAPAANANIIHQLPRNIVISSKRDNTELFSVNNTTTASNHQNQQPANVTPSNVFVAHRPIIPNLVSVSSDSIYDPFATQIQSGLYNVNQNRYTPVNNVQNINMYQTTRYAPASSILIGSTITVAVPTVKIPTPSITVPFNIELPSSETSTVFSPTKDMPNSTWSNQSCHIEPTNTATAIANKPYEPENPTQVIVKEPPELIDKKATEPIAKKPSVLINEIPTKTIPKKSTEPAAVKPADPIARLLAEIRARKPIEPITKKANESISTKSTDPIADTPTELIAMAPSELIAVARNESIDKKQTDSINKKPIELIVKIPTEPAAQKLTDAITSKVTEAEKKEIKYTADDNKLKPEVVHQPNASNSKLENKPNCDLNKNCERKVLSQVQEKQNAIMAEKIDPKNSRSQRLSFETTTKKEASKDQERLMKKRLAIINRQINHCSFDPAIPLTYAPLITLKEIKLISTEDKPTNTIDDQTDLNSTVLNTVITKVGKLQSTPIEKQPASDDPKKSKDTEEFSHENSKENNSNACRRILLRSSNKLKPAAPEVLNKPAGRKTKVRLKSTTTETLEKLGEQITVKHVSKQASDEETNDQYSNKPLLDKAAIVESQNANAKSMPMNDDLTTDETNKIVQDEKMAPTRASKRIHNKVMRKAIEKEKKKTKPKKKTRSFKLPKRCSESNIHVNLENSNIGSITCPNSITNTDFFDIEEALVPIKIPNVNMLHEKISDTIESQGRHNTNTNEDKNKFSVDLKNTLAVNVDAKIIDKDISNVPTEIVSSPEQISGEEFPSVNENEVITSPKKALPEKKETNDKFSKLVNEIESVINVLTKSTTEMLEDLKSKENNSVLSTNGTVFDTKSKLNSTLNIHDKDHDKYTTKPKESKIIYSEPISKLSPIIINNPGNNDDNEKSKHITCKEQASVHNIHNLNKNDINIDPKIKNKGHQLPTFDLEPSGFMCSNQNQILTTSELATGLIKTDQNNQKLNDIHIPQVISSSNVNMESNKITTPKDNISSESIPQGYKDSIKIEELPMINDDPFKKIVRVTLPNKRVFKATIYGKTHVSFDSLFENPELKKILTSGISDKQRYTVNIQQRHSTLDNKVVDARITAINVNPKIQNTSAIETVNLISDDEEEEVEHNFATEFGNYKIKPLNRELLTNHQNKFSQKCSVKLFKIDSHASKPVPKASNTLEDLCKALLSSDDTEYTPTVNEVIDIDDSSNDSTAFPKMQSNDITVAKPAEKINQFKNLLLKDLGVEDVLQISNADALLEKATDISVKNQECGTRQTKKRKSENKNETEVQYEEIINRKYFVKLVRCDDKVKNLTMMTDEDLITIALDENECLDNDENSKGALSRSGSFSILNDLEVFEDLPIATKNESRCSSPVIDIFETIAALGISCSKQDYDRSSPVMEVYDMIASLTSSAVAENIENVKSNHLSIQEQIKCDTEWFATKRHLYLNLSKDVNTVVCINDNKSPSESKTIRKFDDSTDCESVFDITFGSVNSTESLSLLEVPSLISIMSQYFANNSLGYNLKPICAMKQCELAKTTVTLKRKLTNKFTKTNATNKIIKMSTPVSEDVKEEKVLLTEVNAGTDKDIINELKGIVNMSTLNTGFDSKATNATSTFLTNNVVVHDQMMINNVAKQENKDKIVIESDISKETAIRGSDEIAAAATFIREKDIIMVPSKNINIENKTKTDHIVSGNGVEEIEANLKESNNIFMSDEITTVSEIMDMLETNNITSCQIPIADSGMIVNEVENSQKNHSTDNSKISNQIIKTGQDTALSEVKEYKTDFSNNAETASNEITTAFQTIDILENDITSRILKPHLYFTESKVIKKKTDFRINNELTINNEMKPTAETENNTTNDNIKCQVSTSEKDTSAKNDLHIVKTVLRNSELIARYQMNAVSETKDNSENDAEVNDNVKVLLMNKESPDRSSTSLRDKNIQTETESEGKAEIKEHEEPPLKHTTGLQVYKEATPEGFQTELNNEEATNTFSKNGDLQFEEIKTTKVIDSEIDNIIAVAEAELRKSTELVAIDKMPAASETKDISENVTESIGQQEKANDEVRVSTENKPTTTKSKINHSENLPSVCVDSSDKNFETIEKSLNIIKDNESGGPSLADTSLEVQSYIEIECNTSYESDNVDSSNILISDNGKPTDQCHLGSTKTPSPITCTRESSSDIEIIEENNKESIADIPTYKTVKDVVEIDHKYVCETEVFIEVVQSVTVHPEQSDEKIETIEESDDLFTSEVICDENPLEENATLVYKDDSGVILKGIEYDDPIIGACYVFPLSKNSDSSSSDMLNDSTENIDMNHKIESQLTNIIEEVDKENQNYVNKTEEISEIDTSNKIDKIPIEEYDKDIQVTVPKIKYTNGNLKRKLRRDEIINEKRVRRNSKCKCEVACGTSKYRKGRHIDLPKQTIGAISKTSYAKEYKLRSEYYSSVKFSYSLPFHKDYVCVSDLVKGWPIKGYNSSQKSEEEMEHDGDLFSDINFPIRVQQTLAEELLTGNNESDYSRSNTDADETNSNMGFGERSGRVIQNLENVRGISNFSAATLSDVKQSQPLLLSVDNDNYESDRSIYKTMNTERGTIARFMTSIKLRDKVRSFFKTSMLELTSQWLKDKQDKKYSNDSDNLPPYPELSIPTYFEPPLTQFVVQVVQVGQLPVSAAAQNPMNCDPRVTQVSDASPSQCSVDNSPNDGSQEIKTEYTELKTADLSMPLVEDFFSHHHSMNMESHDRSNTLMPNENLPIETEFIKSEVKIEIEEPSQDSLQESPLGERPLGPTTELHEELREQLHNNPYESRVLQSEEARNTEESNYSYEADHTVEPDVPPPEKEMTFETAEEQIISTTNQNINDPYCEEKLQNGTLEKTDQIAHAMSAAGITSSPEPEANTEERPLVNVLLQTRQGSVSTSKIAASNYSKAAPITAMALQQALAQILPPPLNQTNGSESHQQNENPPVGPQVLHIVQGKNASGNQITLVDNSQQSVISTSNATSVLHIVQNKSGSSGPTANGSSTPQTNTFSGLSLVEAGLQQGGNQLLHIVNAGNQKNTNTGQLLKRVNLLTNLTNVQGSNEQKMVQFVCKSADGKAIQLNAPHQRSMVLRLQPIETPQKPAENQEPSSSATHSAQKESVNAQQEIKSRSVYEENYAKFIQNSSNKLPASEKATSLPKFNQAFGKPQFQDGTQKQNEINGNSAHSENPESTENPINLDHISQITSPPLLIRKTNNPTSQAQQNLQQVKQTITPMNIQTMHGGVIYTRQIPVNIGGGQTINLITVPSTELIDESGQKQQAQSDIDQQIIKIVPQSQHNAEASREENNSTNEAQNPQPQPQPVLTQMRIKLPMLSKAPAMVSGARVVRPSFFQIQRNVIGGANQPVYQQLVLTAAPPLGQQTIRIPNARQIKVPDTQTSSESQMSSSTLEQLREFDMVLEQVKERSTGQPKPHTSSNDTTDSSPSGSSAETTQVLYSIGSNQPLNVTYVNRKATVATPSTSTYVRSPDSSGIVDSPTSSTHIQLPHTSAESTSSETPQPKAVKVGSKNKSKSKSHHQPSSSMKINTVPPKTSNQKPLEDEQTTQRILYILAEYKEQVENSPDKDKPAPRRRTNPPTNPSGSSKRKKSGCRRPGMRDMSPIHGEETCRTMGSEDSSCGTSQGDCTESCLETHSPQDSPRKVVRKLTFDNESSTSLPRIQPQRNVFVADGQTITVARGTAGKPTTAVLMPANYILPVSMVKGGQQIAIVTNRGPKILTVGGGEGGTTNALLLQRLIGPAGLKPVLARPGVRHVRLPAAALQNLQAFNLATSTNVQPPDSTASPAPAPTPPEVVETHPESSPWTDRESDNARPDRASSPEGSEPWNLPSSADPHDYTYDDAVRVDNLDRTVLEPIPDRYSPELEAERIFDKMFDVESKKSFIVDSHDDSPRCVYDIDASDSNDKHYQVVHKKDGSQRQHRLAHVSAAALRHKYAILEHELRLQKSLSEECEDLGVDSPSASELFPEAELLFAASPAANDHAHDPPPHAHASQPTILNQGPIQPDIDDQIATDQLIPRERQDLGLGLEDVGIVTVSEDGMQATIELDQEEFARSHPNTTFHSEPTDDGVVQPFTLSGLKGRQITSTIFHANRAPATVLMTAPQTTVISQATAEPAVNVKYDIDNMINSLPGPHTNNINLNSVLVKDDGLTRFDSILTDSRELHLSNTASAIIHSTGNATQVIRRVCYDEEKRDRFLMDEPDAIIAGDDAKMVAEDSSRDATFESMAGDVDDDNSSTERHAELFWESNSASERSEGRRPLDFSSDSDKCCKSPSYDETNSTDSSGVGTNMRLDSVIKDARGLERSGSADGSSADDTQPLRTYQPKRLYHSLEEHADRSLSGKTRAGERSPDMEVRRRASGRGVVKRGCHCCNGSPAPPRPKKPRQRKTTMDFPN